MELTKYKLGDIADISVGFPFESERFNENGIGIRLVRGMNVSERTLRFGDESRWWSDITDNLEAYFLKENDIVIGMDGSKVGKNFALIKQTDLPLLLVQRVACVRAKKGIDQHYIWHYVSSPRFIEYVNTIKTGSAIPHISGKQIGEFPIFVPPLPEQKKIASVLSALDDKIALNKKMNQKLEAMAKRLYDYWFVQFDFPDKNGHSYKTTGGPMTYNPTLKREIPVGWEVKNVNDVTTSVRGVSYSSDDEKSKTDSNVVQILRGNNISGSRFVFDSNDVFVSSDLVAEEQKISKFDIVMTMSSGSKEHVGKSALALYDMPHSFGAFCSKFTPNEEAGYFIDCYLHSEIFIKYIRQTCSGTGINNLTKGHFDKSLFAWPTEDILKAFNEKVSAIYEQRGVIEREIIRLTALRDKLLPLLMNGQVEVG